MMIVELLAQEQRASKKMVTLMMMMMMMMMNYLGFEQGQQLMERSTQIPSPSFWEEELWGQTDPGRTLPLPLINCVTLNKPLNLPFHLCKMGIMTISTSLNFLFIINQQSRGQRT